MHFIIMVGWNIYKWWTKNMNVTYYINLHKWNNQNIKHPTKQNQTPTKINLAPTTLGVRSQPNMAIITKQTTIQNIISLHLQLGLLFRELVNVIAKEVF